MKVLAVLIACALSGVALGTFLGIVTEADTHALHVSRITGAPYVQVLDPLHRDWKTPSDSESQYGDEDEVCAPNIPCEANQD